jgi:hypothetical protein
MNKAKQQFVIVRDGEEKTFDEEGAWKDMQQLLDDNDVEYDAHGPTEADGDKPKTNGENRQSSMMEQQDKIDEQSEDAEEEPEQDEPEETAEPDVVDEPEEPDVVESEPDVVEEPPIEQVPDNPPERNLSDDPVEWFGDIGEFTYTKKGTTCINKKGLRVLQYWYDIDNPDTELVVGPEETDHTFARSKATVEMPDGRTAVAHGSAHVDRGDDPWLLTEMSDTRAKSRVILDVTGMGAVAVSELENEL